MALARQIRQFLILVLVFMTNNDANAEMPWLQDLPSESSQSYLWKIK